MDLVAFSKLEINKPGRIILHSPDTKQKKPNHCHNDYQTLCPVILQYKYLTNLNPPPFVPIRAQNKHNSQQHQMKISTLQSTCIK